MTYRQSISLCAATLLVALVSLPAAADDGNMMSPKMSAQPDAMKSDAMKSDAMKSGAMKSDTMKSGMMKPDAMKAKAMKGSAGSAMQAVKKDSMKDQH
jgi:pentapeptide MXKDX repeat protein